MTIRPLTEAEIELLERSLGRPVDRNSLVYWVSQSIRDVVRLRDLPTARECRDALLVVVREGRGWIHDINHCPCASLIGQQAELDALTAGVARVCDRAEFVAKEFRAAIKPGRHRARFALEAFLDRMIGIAKSGQGTAQYTGSCSEEPDCASPTAGFFQLCEDSLGNRQRCNQVFASVPRQGRSPLGFAAPKRRSSRQAS